MLFYRYGAERDLQAEPDIPLSACVDGDLLFVPEDDADVHILVSRTDIVRSSFNAVMAVSAEAWSACMTYVLSAKLRTGKVSRETG